MVVEFPDLNKYAFKSKSSGTERATTSLVDFRKPSNETNGKMEATKQVARSKPNKSPARRSQRSQRSPYFSPAKSPTSVAAAPESVGSVRVWEPILQPNLKLVFIGFNPGLESWRTGHYYAHFTNLFWKLIYECGLVDRVVTPADDRKLPDEYGIGFTDLVSRSTVGINQLSKEEMREGAASLEARLVQFKPQMVCIVGKGIWEAIYKAKAGKPLKKDNFQWGIQKSAAEIDFAIDKVYVVPSTSGLVAGVTRAEKLRLWQELYTALQELPLNHAEKEEHHEE